jgi:hypothetical protein
MNRMIKSLMIISIVVFAGCQPDTPFDPDDIYQNQNIGIVEFDFPIPAGIAPVSGIHRIDLSLAKTTFDLYRGDFMICLNVSDKERTYILKLEPGDYYFQAGIICSCLGDTCLWDGFQGGRLGTKWAMDRITVVKGEKLTKSIVFNQ